MMTSFNILKRNDRVGTIIIASFILAIIPIVRIFYTLAIFALIIISDEEFDEMLEETVEENENR